MNSTNYSYWSNQQQQQQPTSQWMPSASFYNGYSGLTTAPTLNYQPQPRNIPVSTYTPVRVEHLLETSAPPPMPSRSSNIFRHGFFHHQPQQQQQQQSDQEYYIHEQQLNHNLATNGFQRVLVKGDGNCLFYALGQGLLYQMECDPYEFGVYLRQVLKLPRNIRLADFADRLRQLCVDQWRQNEDYYSQFVDKEKVTFLKEVKKFSKNGVSESTLGDIVPLTIANALNIHIVIFTSLLDLPRIDVKTERKHSFSTNDCKKIYLAYNQSGLGHYDAAYLR